MEWGRWVSLVSLSSPAGSELLPPHLSRVSIYTHPNIICIYNISPASLGKLPLVKSRAMCHRCRPLSWRRSWRCACVPKWIALDDDNGKQVNRPRAHIGCYGVVLRDVIFCVYILRDLKLCRSLFWFVFFVMLI